MANVYDMSDTWNDGATTFTSIKMNVTDTASAAASLLMDLQVGGVRRFNIEKTGVVVLNNFWRLDATSQFNFSIKKGATTYLQISEGFDFCNLTLENISKPSLLLGGALTTAAKVSFGSNLSLIGASNVLEQLNSTNAQTFNLYNTYTDASNYERGRMAWVGNELRFGPESAGTGSSRSLGLYAGGTRYQIIGSNFNQFDKPIYINTTGIATGAGAGGFKIGTATTQGLGFWNATPSAQPTAVADATDAATVITQLNALLARMRTIGLIAT
jgi:hypothetical protein